MMCKKVCSNCGKANVRSKGLCITCYKYQLRTGKPRPQELYDPKPTPVFCTNCKENEVYCLGLCKACYSWQKRHGTKRPRNLWADRCVYCGKPKVERRHKRGVCQTCYQYIKRNGRPRPRRLIEHLKFCDCGNHATRKLRTPHGDIDVCEPCYQLEQSYSAGNGAPQAGTFDSRRMDYHT